MSGQVKRIDIDSGSHRYPGARYLCPVATKGSLAVQQLVAEFFAEPGGPWRREFKTWDEAAIAMGVKKPTLVNIGKNGRGVGPKVEEGFARLKFSGSVDALRKAARAKYPEAAAAEVDRYPNRTRVLERLRGVMPAPVVERVRSIRLKADADQSEQQWLEEAIDELRAWRREQQRAPEEAAADAREAERTTEDVVRRTQPKLPTRRSK